MRRLGDPSHNRLGIKTVPWGLGRLRGGYFRKVLSTEPNNLIGYWIMDEAAGGVSIDSSPEGNDGAYTAVTLGQPGIGDGRTCPLFDGATSFNNIYSAAFNADFNGAEGTFLGWLRVSGAGIWTDGSSHRLGKISVNAANRIYIAKADEDNRLLFLYSAGGVLKTIGLLGNSDLDWMMLAVTWSATDDEFKAYKFAVQAGATQNGLGVWVGNLSATETIIGADSTIPAVVWDGRLAHAAVWTKALTQPQLENLSVL